jgi:exosortase family protein XrtF
MVLSTYRDKWNKVPVAVKRFIFKAFIILLVWKVLYLVFLLPARVLDKPLTYSVGVATTWLLNTYTSSSDYSTRSEISNVATDQGLTPMPLQKIFFHNTNVVSIEDGCNALELFVLYAGFIICMPARILRKTLFIIGGIIAIYITNVIRCAGVAYIIIYHPRYADFAHHYVFTFVVYGLIIALWLIFSKKLNFANAEN